MNSAEKDKCYINFFFQDINLIKRNTTKWSYNITSLPDSLLHLSQVAAMGLGGVTAAFTAGKEDNKLLEEAGRVRDKQPVVRNTLPGPGVQLKVDLHEVGVDLIKQNGKSKTLLSSYSEQDLIQKFFWIMTRKMFVFSLIFMMK